MKTAGGMAGLKGRVKAFWEREPCGSRYGRSDSDQRADFLRETETARYRLDPFLPGFARFEQGRGLRVLEVGVGMGVDFANWVRHGARATGVDLTEAGIRVARERLAAEGLSGAELLVGDAERLPFREGTFDLAYSWGVLHHTPDTPRAFAEVCRVLRPGGVFRGMIYHVPCWTGWLLWFAHGLLAGRPWMTPREAIRGHLESPGTKAYGLGEARAMLEAAGFVNVSACARLSSGDLLDIALPAAYRGGVWRLLQRLYPRWLVRLLGDRFGIYLLLEAAKPGGGSTGGGRGGATE